MSKSGTKVAFVDFAPLWDAVLGTDPGYEAFGYTSPGACFATNSPAGPEAQICADPAHTFYWFPQ